MVVCRRLRRTTLALVDRGAQTLACLRRIDQATADSLKREARNRADRGEFFGFINFVSLIARKPELYGTSVFGCVRRFMGQY
jgi:hypothetical protein